MRSAQTIIEMVHNRGKRGLPLQRVYRLLQNQALYLVAYSRLYTNEGALTAGIDPNNTVEGMSLERIEKVINKLKSNTYQWQPVRRTEIPKGKTEKRPLGIPIWDDKMLQEVIRMILEAYYEPQFSKYSHGFRPNRGCHTALQEISKWKGTKWFIEGDIKGCFDNIDHDILLEIIGEKIQDRKLLKLLKEMLKAGYMEGWKYHNTYSGTPQGGVVSPLLANIILDKLDKFIENKEMPTYNTGDKRRINPRYNALNVATSKAKKEGKVERYRELQKIKGQIPTQDMQDPHFRRLWYVRYADDFIIGFIGPRLEALEIKGKVRQFLQDIKLKMSEEKTLMTHATNEQARFLGYDIHIAQNNTQRTRDQKKAKKVARSINGKPILKVPLETVQEWSTRFTKNGKTVHRPYLLECSDYEIVLTYGLEFQGLANYYALAHDVSRLYKVKHHYMTSLARTIADKHKQNVPWVWRRYKQITTQGITAIVVEIPNPNNPDKPLRARFGYKPLCRNKNTIIIDTKTQFYTGSNELVSRLLANECELCGSNENIRGHHVRKLKDVRKKYGKHKNPPSWAKFMMARNRKVVFVCHHCHTDIHLGNYDGRKVK